MLTNIANRTTMGIDSRFIIAALICAAIFLFIYHVYRRTKINGLNSYQRNVARDFQLTGGDQFDDAAERVIAEGERIPTPTPMDHLMLGMVYLNNAGRPQDAHRHFQEAADQIERGDAPHDEEIPYILGRIHDFRMLLAEDDLPVIEVQRILLGEAAHGEQKAREEKREVKKPSPHNAAARIEITADDPQRVQKSLLNTQFWASDPQNVHDSGAGDEVARQFNFVRKQIEADPTIVRYTYDDSYRTITGRLRETIASDSASADEREAARRTLNAVEKTYTVLANNAHIPQLACTEQEFLATAWKRAHQSCNRERAAELETAMADALADCVEHGNVVCMAGRNKKIWTALAMLDKEPSIGVLKTRQVLLNEISERAAQIVDRHIGPASGIPSEVLAAFNAGENTPETVAIGDQIKREIAALEPEYAGRIEKNFLATRIAECMRIAE